MRRIHRLFSLPSVAREYVVRMLGVLPLISYVWITSERNDLLSGPLFLVGRGIEATVLGVILCTGFVLGAILVICVSPRAGLIWGVCLVPLWIIIGAFSHIADW